ncbi:DUF58 domain-containing protein [bacterium SCSIO 12741]|nr:DUF58 domain-containing protein [bacterium SCSIO 12741]
MKYFKGIFITTRFLGLLGICCFLFVLSFSYSALFYAGALGLLLLFGLLAWDIFRLGSSTNTVKAKRTVNGLLSLSDENPVYLEIESEYSFNVNLQIIDEIPEQLQIRNFDMNTHLNPGESKTLEYSIAPKTRGAYLFGRTRMLVSSGLNLVQWMVVEDNGEETAVYPSVIQMKQFELEAFSAHSNFYGIKRIRKIGHSYEFDHIKNYIQGDDQRSINWKASSRQAKLMVNKYEDERSQPVYSFIDKGRSMKMPFEGLTLMDYAINTSLAISNIVLKKHDRSGLVTFSDKVGSFIRAENRPQHLQRILSTLYNEQERQVEANYEMLYQLCRSQLGQRSLIFLYTNFESVNALQRILPILRKINRLHLLIVMYFSNSELEEMAQQDCKEVIDIYHQTTARKMILEKELILEELKRYGIQAIVSSPKKLSINTINKYLELKSRGLI